MPSARAQGPHPLSRQLKQSKFQAPLWQSTLGVTWAFARARCTCSQKHLRIFHHPLRRLPHRPCPCRLPQTSHHRPSVRPRPYSRPHLRRGPPALTTRGVTDSPSQSVSFFAVPPRSTHMSTHRLKGRLRSPRSTQVRRGPPTSRTNTSERGGGVSAHAHACVASPSQRTAPLGAAPLGQHKY